MDTGFDDEHEDFKTGVGERKKTTVAEPDIVGLEDVDLTMHRHRTYLAATGAAGTTDQSYRPKTVHRASSKRWWDKVDEQVRSMTEHPGMSIALPDWEAPLWAHLKSFMDNNIIYAKLEKCGFMLADVDITNASEYDIRVEDEYAHMFGMLNLHGISFRTKRLMAFWSFPHRAYQMLKPGHEQKCLKEFEVQTGAWNEFFAFVADIHGCPLSCTDAASSSPWHLTSIKQLLHGAREYHFKLPADDLIDKVRARARLAKHSNLIEESIGDMKNRNIARRTTLFRRPETCYYLSLKNGSFASRSNYETPPLDTPLESKSSKLPNHVFTFEPKRRSIPFADIVSTTQKVNYYSPGPPNLGVRHANTYVVTDLKPIQNFALFDQIGLGSLCATEYLFVFNDKRYDKSDVWNLALGNFDNSAVICWPGALNGCTKDIKWWQHMTTIEQPVFRAFTTIDPKFLRVIKLQWRSVAWQRNNVKAFRILPRANRLVTTGKDMSLIQLFAEEAFFELDIDAMSLSTRAVYEGFQASIDGQFGSLHLRGHEVDIGKGRPHSLQDSPEALCQQRHFGDVRGRAPATG